jgi:hypothetical protein
LLRAAGRLARAVPVADRAIGQNRAAQQGAGKGRPLAEIGIGEVGVDQASAAPGHPRQLGAAKGRRLEAGVGEDRPAQIGGSETRPAAIDAAQRGAVEIGAEEVTPRIVAAGAGRPSLRIGALVGPAATPGRGRWGLIAGVPDLPALLLGFVLVLAFAALAVFGLKLLAARELTIRAIVPVVPAPIGLAPSAFPGDRLHRGDNGESEQHTDHGAAAVGAIEQAGQLIEAGPIHHTSPQCPTGSLPGQTGPSYGSPCRITKPTAHHITNQTLW